MWISHDDIGDPELAAGFSCFLRGEYDTALLTISKAPMSARRSLLSAHIAYRARNRKDALSFAREARHLRDSGDEELRMLTQAIEAACNASLGLRNEAEEILSTVDPLAIARSSRCGEITYYFASAAWAMKEYERAEHYVNQADYSDDCNLGARFEFLHGWLAAARGKYVEQLACNVRAIKLLECSPACHVGLLGMVLRSLDWEDAADEEVDTAILATELNATIDPRRACAYLAKTKMMRARVPLWLGLAHDRRLEAFYDFADPGSPCA